MRTDGDCNFGCGVDATDATSDRLCDARDPPAARARLTWVISTVSTVCISSPPFLSTRSTMSSRSLKVRMPYWLCSGLPARRRARNRGERTARAQIHMGCAPTCLMLYLWGGQLKMGGGKARWRGGGPQTRISLTRALAEIGAHVFRWFKQMQCSQNCMFATMASTQAVEQFHPEPKFGSDLGPISTNGQIRQTLTDLGQFLVGISQF